MSFDKGKTLNIALLNGKCIADLEGNESEKRADDLSSTPVRQVSSTS